jgi:hypothetical protein
MCLIQLFCMCQVLAIDLGLQQRFVKAVLARVCALGILSVCPSIYIGLQLLQPAVKLAPKSTGIEFILNGLVKPLTNAIGLR